MICDASQNLACDGKCPQHCDWIQQWHKRCVELHGSRFPSWKIDQQYEHMMRLMEDHVVEVHNCPDNRCKKTANGKYKGPFAFTLTMSPSDGLTEEQMMFAVRKIMEQKSQPVKKFAWYLEYKDEETKRHPHIHGMYETETGRRIEKKHWQRQWKIWDESIPLGAGFRGGYHRPVRSDEAYNQYIAKQCGQGDSHI